MTALNTNSPISSLLHLRQLGCFRFENLWKHAYCGKSKIPICCWVLREKNLKNNPKIFKTSIQNLRMVEWKVTVNFFLQNDVMSRRRHFSQIFWATMKAYKKFFNFYFWCKVGWPRGVPEIEFDFFWTLRIENYIRLCSRGNFKKSALRNE